LKRFDSVLILTFLNFRYQLLKLLIPVDEVVAGVQGLSLGPV